jgi:hypothetical protein
MRSALTTCAFVAVFTLWFTRPSPALHPQKPAHLEATDVGCRAMEVHTDAADRTTVIVFHHRDESNRAALAGLLRTIRGI